MPFPPSAAQRLCVRTCTLWVGGVRNLRVLSGCASTFRAVAVAFSPPSVFPLVDAPRLATLPRSCAAPLECIAFIACIAVAFAAASCCVTLQLCGYFSLCDACSPHTVSPHLHASSDAARLALRSAGYSSGRSGHPERGVEDRWLLDDFCMGIELTFDCVLARRTSHATSIDDQPVS